jgi:hypothetical protein
VSVEGQKPKASGQESGKLDEQPPLRPIHFAADPALTSCCRH